MRILVTGGAGFIGGHLALEFVRSGHDVVALDDLDPFYDVEIKRRTIERARKATLTTDGAAAGVVEATPAASPTGSYEFVEGDVRDAELVAELVADADAVFHQAARAGVRSSVEDPVTPNDVNVGGTLNVLQAARSADLDRVVCASSSSVYGDPEYRPCDEGHPTRPVSPYGVSKLAAEQYASVFAEVYGLPTVSLRYFTVYGPRMRPNMAITNFTSRCFHGEPPEIYGDGSQTRDFTHVDDVVRVNRQLLTDDAADGEVLNVGSGETITVADLADVVVDAIDPSLELVFDERRTGDTEHTHADVSKANRVLGYEPTYGIREGVHAFIEWYRANREWYEPLVRRS